VAQAGQYQDLSSNPVPPPPKMIFKIQKIGLLSHFKCDLVFESTGDEVHYGVMISFVQVGVIELLAMSLMLINQYYTLNRRLLTEIYIKMLYTDQLMKMLRPDVLRPEIKVT
jgi:hypothetical protein